MGLIVFFEMSLAYAAYCAKAGTHFLNSVCFLVFMMGLLWQIIITSYGLMNKCTTRALKDLIEDTLLG
jgi:hypothetical protein